VADKAPVSVSATAWGLCLALVAAAAVLGPAYLIDETPKLADLAAVHRFLAPSAGWAREILAAAHVAFVLAMVLFTMLPFGRRLAGRMAGVAIAVGVWEILLSVLAAWLLGDRLRFAAPHVTVAALGALLFLGGAGLSLEGVLARLAHPKTPVILIFVVGAVLGVAAFGLLGVLNVRHYARVDYTRAGRYSLAPATLTLLRELDHEVRVTTLFVVRDLRTDTLRREATDLLEEYTRVINRVTVEHINPRRDVKAANELKARLARREMALEENSVVFECAETGRVYRVAAHEMIPKAEEPPTEPDDAAAAERAAPVQYAFLGEGIFHEALAVVTGMKPARVYFVVGHGEKPEAVGPPTPMMNPTGYEEWKRAFAIDYLQQGLRRRYYRLETLNLDDLPAGEGIPEDCDVLVIAGPWFPWGEPVWGTLWRPFSKSHAELVWAYLERGGKALIMLDPMGASLRPQVAPLFDVLRDYGVEVNTAQVVLDDLILYRVGRRGTVMPYAQPSVFFAAEIPMAYETGSRGIEVHPGLRSLQGEDCDVWECAEVHAVQMEGLRHTALLRSSERSWLQAVGVEHPGPERPMTRPRDLAVAVEKAETGEPIMVVLGSSNLFIQPIIRSDQRTPKNEAFAQKLVAWLAGRAEPFEVRPTEVAYGKVKAEHVRAIRFVSIVVIPSLFILLGAAVWIVRRK